MKSIHALVFIAVPALLQSSVGFSGGPLQTHDQEQKEVRNFQAPEPTYSDRSPQSVDSARPHGSIDRPMGGSASELAGEPVGENDQAYKKEFQPRLLRQQARNEESAAVEDRIHLPGKSGL